MKIRSPYSTIPKLPMSYVIINIKLKIEIKNYLAIYALNIKMISDVSQTNIQLQSI